MAAFRCFWRPETSVLVMLAVRRVLVVRHAGQSLANFGALVLDFSF